MSKPKELDVPHWAREPVKTTRVELQLPDTVTDRMIYARLLVVGGLEQEAARNEVLKLKLEVENTDA